MVDKKQMWMDFLNSNAEDDETLDRLAKDSPVMEKAVAVLRRMSADEKELYEIEQRDKALRDEVSARKYERQQGFAQGVEKGIKQGLNQGIKQGAEKEREKLRFKLQNLGMSEEQIQAIFNS